MGIVAYLLNWLACHLVAIVFAGFALVAFFFQEPLLDPDQGQESKPAELMSKAGVSNPASRDTSAPANQSQAAEEHSSIGSTEERQALQAPTTVFRPLNASVPTEASSIGMPSQRFPAAEGPVKDVSRVQPPDLLREARAAFRRNDFEQAESLYLHYLGISPGDAVGFAELGDLYRATQRGGDALDAFYEAGIRFQKRGESRQLARIQRILAESGDPRAGEFAGR